MKKITTILASVAIVGALSAQAEILDKGKPADLFNLSFRAGINQSNISNNLVDAMPNDVRWTSTSWGTGFGTGVVADINIRNYLSVEPGVFFQMRQQSYTNAMLGKAGIITLPDAEMEQGSTRYFDINVPIMFVLHLNLSEKFETRVEAGPYVQWGFGGRDKSTTYALDVPADGSEGVERFLSSTSDKLFGSQGSMRGFDWGFKMGLGFQYKRYYLGVHYLAGCSNVYQPRGTVKPLSGRNKAWEVTVGYTLF